MKHACAAALLCLSIGSLLFGQTPDPLPPRSARLNGFSVRSRQAMAEETEALLVRSSPPYQYNGTAFAPSAPSVPAPTPLTLLSGEPWVVSEGSGYLAYYLCCFSRANAAEAVAFFPSDRIFFKSLQHNGETAGIRLMPTALPSEKQIVLDYQWVRMKGNRLHLLPLSIRTPRFAVKLIAERTEWRQRQWEILKANETFVGSGEGFLLSGKKLIRRLSDNQLWITDCQRWIPMPAESEPPPALPAAKAAAADAAPRKFPFYDYDRTVLFPVSSLQIRYRRLTDSATGQLIAVEKQWVKRPPAADSAPAGTAPPASFETVACYEHTAADGSRRCLCFPTTATVNENALRMRSLPSAKGKILTLLRQQTPVQVLAASLRRETIGSKRDFWYRIREPSGKSGWVFGAYLTFAALRPSAGKGGTHD